jgi:CBS domain-containing protein
MKAADVMTRTVIGTTPETTVAEAARSMLQHRISGLPVIDASGAVVGIVTEGDLLRRIELGTERHRSGWFGLLFGPGRLAEDYIRSRARLVGEIMTPEVFSVAPKTGLAEVTTLMETRHVKRLPVVEEGRLVGIVSRANLVGALAKMLAAQHGAALSDDEIRQRILAEIDKQPWGPRQSVAVTVKDGVVELSGTILDEREGAALRVAAECLPGVKAVYDHLVWVEPNSGMTIPAAQ